MRNLVLIFILLFIIVACKKDDNQNDTNLSDCPASFVYGNQTYHAVMIGGQCWMKENLNVGEMIDIENPMTDNNLIEKYCYDNWPDHCE